MTMWGNKYMKDTICYLNAGKLLLIILYFILVSYTTQGPIPGLYSLILPQVAYKWENKFKDSIHKICGNIAFLFNMPITGCFISHNINILPV